MAGGRPTSKKPSFLGAQLSKARKTAGLSQNELAAKIDINRNLIAQWERSAVSLKAEQLLVLADVLNTTVDELLGRKPKKQRGQRPAGRAQRAFAEVSQLPRSQQQRILATVEDMLIAHKAKAS